MPVAALVVTLHPDPSCQARALDALGREARITLGEQNGVFLPLVTETRTVREGRDLAESLERMQGVESVAVVAIDFEARDHGLDGPGEGCPEPEQS